MKKLVKPVAKAEKRYYRVSLMHKHGSKEEGCRHDDCFKCPKPTQ